MYLKISLTSIVVFGARLSGLGPWEVVASGSAGGAVGVVQPVAQLPSEAPKEAQVLLVETMTGWEERSELGGGKRWWGP